MSHMDVERGTKEMMEAFDTRCYRRMLGIIRWTGGMKM